MFSLLHLLISLIQVDTKVMHRNIYYCTITFSRDFGNFILTDEPFAKAFKSLKTSISLSNNLCGKLVSLLEPRVTFKIFYS